MGWRFDPEDQPRMRETQQMFMPDPVALAESYITAGERLKKLLKEDKKDGHDKKHGLSARETFWIMFCLSPLIGWLTSEMVVRSLIGMRHNLDLIIK